MAVVLPQRGYRWNFTVMGLDITFFILSLSFASVTTVLPLFIQHLTPSNWALGALTTFRSVGIFLPPILIAGYTERLLRKKPFLLACTTFERIPYLILAGVTPLLAGAHPTLLLWLLFALITMSTAFGGIGMPAWIDLISRTIPDGWRGRFFGLFFALGGLLGIAGAAGAAELLHRFGWPGNFALCFLCTSVGLVISFFFLLSAREPLSGAVSQAPTHNRLPSWRRLPTIVRNDSNFGYYLVATALITTAGMAASFYTVDAKRVLHLSDAGAGLYAVVLLAASTLGNILWGYVGDRFGHKRVVEGGGLCTGLSALLALAGGLPNGGTLIYGLVFALIGIGSSGIQMAGLTFVVDFAPQGQRPTYVGLANLINAPFALAPFIAGVIADAIGYSPVFILSALLALGGAFVVVRLVHDPRMRLQEAQEAALTLALSAQIHEGTHRYDV